MPKTIGLSARAVLQFNPDCYGLARFVNAATLED